MRLYVLEHYSASTWDTWVASLPHHLQQILSSESHDAVHDEALHVEALTAFCARFRGGSASIAFELGRFSAAMDLLTSRSFRFNTVRPIFIIKNINTFWRRDHDTGWWELEVRNGELIATLRGWEGNSPEACQRLLGYMICLLESFGPIKSYSHTECRCFGAEHCRFHCRWEIERLPNPKILVSSVGDLFSAFGEIAASTTVEHLVEVTVCLFRHHFLCPFVRVSLRRSGDGAMEAVAWDGEASGDLRSIELTAGSQEVGKIEVEPPVKWPDWLTEEVLQSATSLLAYMIASESRGSQGTTAAPITWPPSSSSTAEELLDCQLRRARKSWKLTETEVQLLRLFVLGTRIVDIAAELDRSRSTIDHHMAEIRFKAGANSSLELLVKFWSLR
jgi:DNA-binding CsgD family transcriptional regulator